MKPTRTRLQPSKALGLAYAMESAPNSFILFLLRPSARRHRKLQCAVHFLESVSKTREANRLAKVTLLLPGEKATTSATGAVRRGPRGSADADSGRSWLRNY